MDAAAGKQPRIVIVGAGFGGLSAAKALRRASAKVTLIDRTNYHLFQPLLYQVATAELAPSEIAVPLRSILRDQENAEILLGTVNDVDLQARTVILQELGQKVSYDYLVVATGAQHSYFGHDEWERYAPGLKTVEEATAIRRRILLAFERAETETDPEERRRLLTFVIVGGGPTGVEMAGAIAGLAKRILVRDFRHIDPRSARIILIEGQDRLLSTYPENLSMAADRSLERLGVEVWLSKMVETCDEDGVVAGGQRIEARTIIWGAGNAASPAAQWLNADRDRAGRVKVAPDLSLPGHSEVFVIGDTALVTMDDGSPVPGVAPAAKQQGEYVAKVISAKLAGHPAPEPFRYRNLGNLATIGRSAAIADFGWLRISGFFAWVLWGLVHIYFLIGFRNRFAVAAKWLWAYFTVDRGARLIIGAQEPSSRSAPPPS
ncbi:NAD(P)/FAD-dependent oxidoreductase [Rhodospirillaceae bacterium SYSU D60014]|uniref:NAD(P)/FAD-dependent oxidoreductase n=1 Tax=Virgifigura deserti TaxID=2268457 RepID=UPI000E66B866